MPAKTTIAPRAVALLIAIGGLTLAPLGASAALATQGSVPSVVAAYASDPDGMLARLNDLFGKGAAGKGLDFGDDTKVGELDRAYAWTADFLAGASEKSPIKLTNEWTATITIADKPVGVATVWINPATDAPDLASFTEGASVGAAFAALPADAALVHDTAHSAWFTLTGNALDPLVAGDSGVSASTSLADYQKRAAESGAPPVVAAATNQGAINSTIVVVVAVLLVAGLIVFAGRRSSKTADAAAQPPADAPSALPAAVRTVTSPVRTVTSPAKTPKPRTPQTPTPPTRASQPTASQPIAPRTRTTQSRATPTPSTQPRTPRPIAPRTPTADKRVTPPKGATVTPSKSTARPAKATSTKPVTPPASTPTPPEAKSAPASSKRTAARPTPKKPTTD